MRAAFVDANASLADVMRRLHRADDLPVAIHEDPDISPEALPALLKGVEIAIDDHTHFPVDVVKRCPDLKHIVFLGTGARSYMDPEALEAECGVKVHIIKGYGDTAVAEMAFALPPEPHGRSASEREPCRCVRLCMMAGAGLVILIIVAVLLTAA